MTGLSATSRVAGVKLGVNLRLASLAGAKHYIIAVANYVNEQIYDLTGDVGVNIATNYSLKQAVLFCSAGEMGSKCEAQVHRFKHTRLSQVSE